MLRVKKLFLNRTCESRNFEFEQTVARILIVDIHVHRMSVDSVGAGCPIMPSSSNNNTILCSDGRLFPSWLRG